MNDSGLVQRTYNDFGSAIAFLTRFPVSSVSYDSGSLARAAKFFPLVGLILGSAAGLLHLFLLPHVSRIVAAIFVVLFLALSTGCLHEDGLADALDGFGGGTSRDRILLIMRDSRIGSYGGVGLVLSLLCRVFLLSSVPSGAVLSFLATAHVLSRWTAIPLAYYLRSARSQDEISLSPKIAQGVRLEHLTRNTLIWATVVAFTIVGFALRQKALAPLLAAIASAFFTGWYYKKRIAGVTGDCFGATNQVTEILVYLCGAWVQ
jgi:adenosylcobinamide-GDP ribazoletransferase